MGSFPVIIAGLLAILACATPQVASQRSREVAQQWSVFDYPNPQFDYALCRRPNVSSVCDPNSIISSEDADTIDGLISSIYRETTCFCYDCITNKHGYIIRVALMPRIERVYRGGDNTTTGLLRDAQMYSYILSQRWRMEGSCNETLLILFARDDGLLYTLTRQRTRMTLSDNDVKTISMRVRSYFDMPNTIGAGIIELIRRYRLVFDDKRSEAFQSASVGSQG